MQTIKQEQLPVTLKFLTNEFKIECASNPISTHFLVIFLPDNKTIELTYSLNKSINLYYIEGNYLPFELNNIQLNSPTEQRVINQMLKLAVNPQKVCLTSINEFTEFTKKVLYEYEFQKLTI